VQNAISTSHSSELGDFDGAMKIIRDLDNISFAGGSTVTVVVMAASSGCGTIMRSLY